MSTLGKIVTVFVVIAAVTVAVMVATFVKMSDDWRSDALRAEEVVKKQGKAIDTFKSALTARDSTIAANANTHLLKVTALNTDIGRLGTDKKDLADKLGVDYELCKVTEINEIMKRGVMLTPALAIDGKVEVSGKVAGEDEITTMLTNHMD